MRPNHSRRDLTTLIPALSWLRQYDRRQAAADGVAAVIVTVILIPQSLAYALLAGVPAEMGLYASMLPLVAYAVFGTSRTLSVGPVAIISLMTAAALARVAAQESSDYLSAAVVLALLSGAMLLALGVLRFGLLANFLSHSVVSGFITASALLILLSQTKHLFGVAVSGDTLPELLRALADQLAGFNRVTLAVGLGTVFFLLWAKARLKSALVTLGVAETAADMWTKAAPAIAVLLTTALADGFDLEDYGVALIGEVPRGLPVLRLPEFSMELWRELAVPALMISIIGYVESISMGRTLGAKRRQRVDPDQELIGLGAANIAAAMSGGIPVTGGLSRSVVNFEAGAVTQAASLMTALGIALATLFLTPLLAYLPKATLAATIIVAVSSLIDFSMLERAWRYAKSDFSCVLVTIVVTLGFGVETGVLSGVGLSLLLHLYKTSRPHMAIVGQIPGTEHFRNIERHDVITCPEIITIRIDESLYFANASYIEDALLRLVSDNPDVRHIVLHCAAINHIDMSALEVLEAINERLNDSGVKLHLSEVKGPVMDGLQLTGFLEHLTGEVFLSQHLAFDTLSQGKLTNHDTRQE